MAEYSGASTPQITLSRDDSAMGEPTYGNSSRGTYPDADRHGLGLLLATGRSVGQGAGTEGLGDSDPTSRFLRGSAATFTVEVPPVNLVNAEILAVTSAMRKNQRWATMSSSASVASTSRHRFQQGVHTSPSINSSSSIGGSLGGSSSSKNLSSRYNPAAASSSSSLPMGTSRSKQSPTSLNGQHVGGHNEPHVGSRRASHPSGQNGRIVGGRYGDTTSDSRSGGGGGGGGNLMSGFVALKKELREVGNIDELDALVLLHPFLEVVRSPETSGPITATALSSIDKFITYSILLPTSTSLRLAMAQLSTAATHCKFEASDSVSDEIVLLKILDVLRNILTSGNGLGGVLSDESICEMMETGLSMCCQMRLSEMLRRSAERTMQAMVAAVFSRLRYLDPEEDAALIGISRHQLGSSVSVSDVVNGTAETSHVGSPSNGVEEAREDTPADGTVGLGVSVKMTVPDPTSGQVPGATADSIVQDAQQQHETVQSSVLAEIGVDGIVDQGKIQDDGLLPLGDGHDDEEHEEDDTNIVPFGVASIQELLRVLISLLNPHDQQHTDSMRLMALGLLNIAFEVGGRSIGKFPSLRIMVCDHLCKHLFQLARSDNIQLLSNSLRVITNIFDTMRTHLKLQQELFLSFLLDRLVLPPPSTTPGTRKVDIENSLDLATWARDGLTSSSNDISTLPPHLSSSSARELREREQRERERERERDRERNSSREHQASQEARDLMLEIVAQCARGAWSMVDLWVNYDCNVEGEDLFERLVKFVSRGVFPGSHGSSYSQDNSQILCLDTILELIAHMAIRLDDEPIAHPTNQPSFAEEVAKAKANKQVLLEGSSLFNQKPKIGLAYLEEHQVIYEDPSVPREESLARFFKTCPKLDKKLLGDFISRPDQLEVLRAFMRLMEFEGKMICDAMRELLEAFRLPGESQQIARITETFAEVYFATQPAEIKSQDATYVLSYSVIMLNTDLHSPQKRMDIAAYSRNLRGVNDNSDFAPEYLKSIYDSIRKREIVLPEEHQNQVGFEYGWKELLRRTRQTGPYTTNESNEFDKGMFTIAWKPIVSAISFAFVNFQDDYMVQRAIEGFNQCAALAAQFNMQEVFDYLILSLSQATGLVPAKNFSENGNFPVIDVEGQKITVSPLSVRFGTSVKAQLAAVVLFTIANNNGPSIRKGWRHIFEILQTLFVHSLLPPSLLAVEDFLSGESMIPLKPKAQVAPREDRRNDGGLLSTLSSYLLSPYGSAPEVSGNDFTDNDIESTLSAVDCIASCRIEELYLQILDLQGDALVAPVQVLSDLTQQVTVDRVRPRQGSHTGSNSPQINVTTSRVLLPYDPSAVLLLEVLTSVVSKSGASIPDLWPVAFDFLSKLIASASSFSSLFNERVVASLLRLVVIVVKFDELRDSTFLALDMLRGLHPSVLATVAEPLMRGLSKLFVENADRIHSTTEWNLIFALFSATIQQEEAAKLSFDLLRRLVSGQLGTGLQADNYSSFLRVLASFASVTSPPSKGNEPRANDETALQRGRQIVDILRETQAAIPQLIDASPLSGPRAWEASWIPLLAAYAHLCLNPSRELRQIAISSLQRTLLAPEILQNGDVDLTIIFERVFFPMLEDLLKPQVFRRDPEGMGETRLRASALLCKIFLQYLTQLSERQGMQTMTELWLKILGYQDRFMHSGRRDQMFEAVPESLKNVLLVMNASGFLIPPYSERTPEQTDLWNATFERIQPFLPELKTELFPPPPVPVPFSGPTAAPEARPASANADASEILPGLIL